MHVLMSIVPCLFCKFSLLFLISWDIQTICASNERPIIGILAQETPDRHKPNGDTFITISYVQNIHSAGGRVVPILTNKSVEYYENLFNHINGVLFPGGEVDIVTSKMAEAARIIYKLAVQANDQGDYFPLWGTCLGFELLTALTSGRNLMSHSDAEDLPQPLGFSPGYRDSKLFANIPDDLVEISSQYNVTPNYHNKCITPETFENTKSLREFYKVLSTNRDRQGKEYISTFEAHDYPIYGVQWHPEKTIYVWDTRKHINHSFEAVRLSQYMANFFVNEARKNNHHYPTEEDAASEVIENHQPVFFGAPSFETCYFFNYTREQNANNAAVYKDNTNSIAVGIAPVVVPGR